MWSPRRYRSEVYGQHFLDAQEALIGAGLAEHVRRGFKFDGAAGQLSTIRPMQKLQETLGFKMSGWEAFTRLQSEVLVLRAAKSDGEAEPLEYAETQRTRQLRRQVIAINKILEAAPLRFQGSRGLYVGQDEGGQPIDPLRRSVRRIFNNGSWNQGGRLFDGFWETMRREDRFEILRIATEQSPEGEPVANVDFGQLFPRLAYVRS
jgi:hypothetical protein